MKIKLTKKRNSVSVRFSAESSQEGVDLKDLVMAAADAPSEELLSKSIEGLERLGYRGGITKETRNTREFILTKKEEA